MNLKIGQKVKIKEQGTRFGLIAGLNEDLVDHCATSEEHEELTYALYEDLVFTIAEEETPRMYILEYNGFKMHGLLHPSQLVIVE